MNTATSYAKGLHIDISYTLDGASHTVGRPTSYAKGLHIDISYTLDGASHTVGRRKLKPDRRRWSFPRG